MILTSAVLRRIATALTLVVAWLPGPLRAQTPQATEPPELRGELVRFGDASIDVSVFARDVEAVPQSVRSRLQAVGTVSFLGEGSAEGNERAHRWLEGLEGLRIEDVSTAAELPPVGVQVQEGDQVRLVWYHMTESEGVAILADARAAYEPFALRILIPDPSVTQDDWWGLQAAVSKAGIRRVQIVSGQP